MYVDSFMWLGSSMRFFSDGIPVFEDSGVIEEELLRGEYEEGTYGCFATPTHTDPELELFLSNYLPDISNP